MNIKGQGHSLILGQGHLDFIIFQISFPEKPLGRLKPIFMWILLGEVGGGGAKVCSNGPGHMTNISAMPIYDGKTWKILLCNLKGDDFESWYAASGTWVLSSY